MRYFFFIAVSIIFAILFLVGCTDEPNDVGIGFLSPKDAIKLDSLKIVSDTTRTDTSRIIGSSTTILLGRYQNSSNAFETRLLLDFGTFSTSGFPIIDSAKISFTIVYRFKDSSGTFGFTAHQIYSTWSQGTFTWDSLSQLSFDNTNLAQFGDRTITTTDTTLTVHFDSANASKWLRTDSTSIILIPSFGTNFVLGFNNYLVLRPQLTVSYRDSITQDTSFSYTVRTTRGMYVANGSSFLPTPDSMFVVQSAIAYRGQLKFNIPDSLRTKHASITQAELDVFFDSISSLRNAFTNNSIEARMATTDSISPRLSSLNTSATPDSQGTYKFDVKNFVQLWTNGTANYGVVLRATDEFISFDRFSFYGAKSLAHPPKLKITYTVFPTKRAAR